MLTGHQTALAAIEDADTMELYGPETSTYESVMEKVDEYLEDYPYANLYHAIDEATDSKYQGVSNYTIEELQDILVSEEAQYRLSVLGLEDEELRGQVERWLYENIDDTVYDCEGNAL